MLRKTDPTWASLVDQWKATQNELRGRAVVRPLDPLEVAKLKRSQP